jgi:cephalosporin-C deacetylase
MPRTDLPLDELWSYRPDLAEPAGFDGFWADTLAEAAAVPLDVELHRIETGLVTIETYDVTFRGFGGDPIRAWLHLPAAPLPRSTTGVVQYIGYNGGRGLPHEYTFWAQAGHPHLVMDTRGQGSGWSVGDTADPHGGSGPAQPGFLTHGIESPAGHYYRRVFVDAVRAVEVMRGQVERVAVTGASQGGGIALAVAGLVDDLVAVMPDVPFLCHFRRAVDVALGDPYAEITRYLAAHRDKVARTFDTLAHFDGVLHARRASAPALFSVAMMDQICPPSTVFAAYHSYAGTKRIEVYEFNDHEGGAPHQLLRQARWLASVLA